MKVLVARLALRLPRHSSDLIERQQNYEPPRNLNQMIERPPAVTRTGIFLVAVVLGMILTVVLYRYLGR
jgi:hypothetical protein